jgi:hypothetical protein
VTLSTKHLRLFDCYSHHLAHYSLSQTTCITVVQTLAMLRSKSCCVSQCIHFPGGISLPKSFLHGLRKFELVGQGTIVTFTSSRKKGPHQSSVGRETVMIHFLQSLFLSTNIDGSQPWKWGGGGKKGRHSRQLDRRRTRHRATIRFRSIAYEVLHFPSEKLSQRFVGYRNNGLWLRYQTNRNAVAAAGLLCACNFRRKFVSLVYCVICTYRTKCSFQVRKFKL